MKENLNNMTGELEEYMANHISRNGIFSLD